MAIQCCFKRVEKKYLLSRAQYEAIRRGIEGRVKPDEHPQYTICNVYYDTPDYRLIRASLEKPVYKEKLRLRSYGPARETDPVFVELKKKFDGVVYKRRVTVTAGEAAAWMAGGRPEKESQISREIDWFLQSYRPEPKVFLAYDREALAGVEDPELRVTFDTGIRCREREMDLRCGDQGILLLPEDQVLMELKLPGTTPLWLARLLGENRVYPTSFSKYGTFYQQKLAGRIPATAYQKEVLKGA